MKEKDVDDFAKTKHKGLPEKVKENKIYTFKQFNESKKTKDVSKELRKDINRKERERRIESGADLQTKVVPDKKKKYNRQKVKKVNFDD